VLIVSNNIEHLPLTSLRVIRGKSLIRVKVPPYAAAAVTDRPTTTASSYVYDDGGDPKSDVWNVSRVHEDAKWKNASVEDEQTDAGTTASDSQGVTRLSCSLFIASNAKSNSTSVGLKEIHLTSLHGQ